MPYAIKCHGSLAHETTGQISWSGKVVRQCTLHLGKWLVICRDEGRDTLLIIMAYNEI